MTRYFAAAVLLLTMAILSTSDSALARVISYQGVLYDSTGGTQQSTVNLTFSLYTSASKSGSEVEWMAWSESHPGVSVASNGTFSVELGSITTLPDSIFAQQLWLEITVNGQVMSPRTRLGSSSNALTSNRLIGDFKTYQGGLIAQNPLDSNRWVDIGWKGIYIPLDTFYYPIVSSGAWIPATSTTSYSINTGGGAFFATGTGSSDSAFFFAEVHLPDEVKVIGITAYIWDGDANDDMSFVFGYRGGTVATNIATLSSSGSNPSLWHDISISLNHTINAPCGQAYFVKAIARGQANAWGNVCLMCTRNRIN